MSAKHDKRWYERTSYRLAITTTAVGSSALAARIYLQQAPDISVERSDITVAEYPTITRTAPPHQIADQVVSGQAIRTTSTHTPFSSDKTSTEATNTAITLRDCTSSITIVSGTKPHTTYTIQNIESGQTVTHDFAVTTAAGELATCKLARVGNFTLPDQGNEVLSAVGLQEHSTAVQFQA